MKGLVEAYHVLCDVYTNGSFVGEAVKKHSLFSDPASLRVVYGTIENHFLYEYKISCLTKKTPKKSLSILLKMGMYLIDHMDDMPDYAAVDEVVKLTKSIGKAPLAGFVNAVLRQYVSAGNDFFPTDETEALALRSNRPLWLVKRYITECGKERAIRILSAKGTDQTHLRPSITFGQDALRHYLEENAIEYCETECGFLVSKVGKVSELLREGKVTVMSLGSIKISSSVPTDCRELLDMCAAPGGKSVYLAERINGTIIACDLYPHRVKLIRSYAERMHVRNIQMIVMDHTLFEPSFEGRFTSVLLDAPCSGLGTLISNPDVILNRKESDIDEIIEVQRKLIRNGGRYVANGGTLVYSTCSDLPSEDEWIVKEFLSEHSDYVLKSESHTEIDEKGGEGYYYAVLERK